GAHVPADAGAPAPGVFALPRACVPAHAFPGAGAAARLPDAGARVPAGAGQQAWHVALPRAFFPSRALSRLRAARLRSVPVWARVRVPAMAPVRAQERVLA